MFEVFEGETKRRATFLGCPLKNNTPTCCSWLKHKPRNSPNLPEPFLKAAGAPELRSLFQFQIVLRGPGICRKTHIRNSEQQQKTNQHENPLNTIRAIHVETPPHRFSSRFAPGGDHHGAPFGQSACQASSDLVADPRDAVRPCDDGHRHGDLAIERGC